MSAMRRVVPAGYRVFELTLTGVTPLLMSSGEADRDSDTYVAFEALGRKRGKTPEDKNRLRELEWYVRLYADEELGPYIPGKNVKELLRSAATKWRKGQDVVRSLIIPDYRIPLLYDGPRDPSEMWASGQFADTRMVANAGAGSGRVDRTRPCFDEWKLITELAIDPEDLSDHELETFVDRSTKYGLGDYRPEFGSFIPDLRFVREQRENARANGTNPVNERDRTANEVRARQLIAS